MLLQSIGIEFPSTIWTLHPLPIILSLLSIRGRESIGLHGRLLVDAETTAAFVWVISWLVIDIRNYFVRLHVSIIILLFRLALHW